MSIYGAVEIISSEDAAPFSMKCVKVKKRNLDVNASAIVLVHCSIVIGYHYSYYPRIWGKF